MRRKPETSSVEWSGTRPSLRINSPESVLRGRSGASGEWSIQTVRSKRRAKDEERNVFLVFLAKPSMENLARETISFDIYLVDTINKVSGRKKKIQANRRYRLASSRRNIHRTEWKAGLIHSDSIPHIAIPFPSIH